ncbi:MBL fold metallo-hydrolase [Actinacidiphila rubida]|uniref:Glyoxylase, beta-lactamase superfamily II n=1 Tax=Actinacidiphila rubida TaxID=310780 RepID=A0A1H8K7E9_9ACTN|nr:MBL fold metallo-hydrolase [Actinacidiphila rubida]SEN88637.1 Glyoxylase, beta-lactamase superfamily II [Actinacidiphila rubida]
MSRELPSPTGRRTFLKGAAGALAVPAAAGLVGALAAPARADDTGLPDFAPVPAASAGPAPNSDGYYVGRISGHLYWVTDTYYQAMFLTTTRGVVLVDAPPTIGHNLLRAIDDITRANGRPSRVTHLVYSHSHADHIGAAGLFGPDVERISHAATAGLLARAADPNRPLPTVTFRDRYRLDVGGETLQLAYHGPNHSPDNIFVYAPDHATLMLVDVLYPGWVPFKNLAVSQDIPDWITAQRIAMDYPWKTFVGGHLGRLGVRADGTRQIQYMDDLEASTRAAIDSVDPSPYFAKYGAQGNAWAIFRTFLDAVADTAAAPVAAKYAGVLAAADVFTKDNAWALLESLRIDAGVLGPFGVRP